MTAAAVPDRFIALLGADRVRTDAAVRAAFSEDISGPGPVPVQAVLRPADADAVAGIARIARAAGVALLPRGGGMSYTHGYAAAGPAVALDLSDLNRVLEVDPVQRCVVVETGCTWAALHEVLAQQGLRTPFFGPLSGIAATIGGALSQNGAFFGSGARGYAADHVHGLELADSTGALHRVGAWGMGRLPALPCYGPGILGLFLGDCGALGIKTKAVLPVEPIPPAPLFASFALDDDVSVLSALRALRDIPHLAEVWAFDSAAHRNLAATGFSVLETAQMAADVAGGSGLVGAARNLLRASALRRAVLTDLPWSLHVVIEPPLAELAPPLADAVRAAVDTAGGREIPDTIPRVTRARPFRTIKALIGPTGERWLPCHGVFPAGCAADGLAAVRRTLAARRKLLPEQGITTTLLLVAVAGDIIVEPQIYWPDSLSGFQLAHAPAAQAQPFREAPGRPDARQAAQDLRHALTEALAGAGAAHMQIGRHYAYRDILPDGMRATFDAVKRALDPDGILNPGVLSGPPAP